MRACWAAGACLVLPLMAACAFDDDIGDADLATFSGPVLQRTAIRPDVLARAYARPNLATRWVVIHSDYSVVGLWRGHSTCPYAGG
ncbi:MAG: hypothetical protein IRY94_16835 [Rhodospirillaceae bacterium]|nr:hypothetical protein [Rhodospirillaceae bacterium]